VHLPAFPVPLGLHPFFALPLMGIAGLMRKYTLLPALEAAATQAQAASCHVLVILLPFIMQPMLPLRLPLWRGLLIPLGLELIGTTCQGSSGGSVTCSVCPEPLFENFRFPGSLLKYFPA